MSFLWDALPGEGLGAIYARLAAVLFGQGRHGQEGRYTLSGGEAARLLWRAWARSSPRCWCSMSPPTTRPEGIQSLAEGLQKYEGTILFVSHDRSFVEQVATRIGVEITPDGIEDFQGPMPSTWAEMRERTTSISSRSLEREREKRRERKRQSGRTRRPSARRPRSLHATAQAPEERAQISAASRVP